MVTGFFFLLFITTPSERLAYRCKTHHLGQYSLRYYKLEIHRLSCVCSVYAIPIDVLCSAGALCTYRSPHSSVDVIDDVINLRMYNLGGRECGGLGPRSLGEMKTAHLVCASSCYA